MAKFYRFGVTEGRIKYDLILPHSSIKAAMASVAKEVEDRARYESTDKDGNVVEKYRHYHILYKGTVSAAEAFLQPIEA